jgi:hypothetical protein
MNSRQLAELQKLLQQKSGQRKKQALKFAFPPEATADEIRERWGSVDLALEFVGLGLGAWNYRYRQGMFPEADRWMLDFLLSTDLETHTGIPIPDDYRQKSQHLADIRRDD